MIISTKKGTPKEELEKIVDRFEKQGLDVTLITGKDYNVFGLVGDTTKIDERDVLANPWIDNVTRVSAPYKRANRLFHPADSVIDCGGRKADQGSGGISQEIRDCPPRQGKPKYQPQESRRNVKRK
jgi:3-deoxy-7-phosphoheptulonate synthase